MGVSYTFSGFTTLPVLIQRVADIPITVGKNEFKTFANDVFEESQVQCPVETGNLQASGQMEDVSGPDRQEYDISYDAGYALFVHEGHEQVVYGHRTGTVIAPNKFLENAVISKSSELEPTISAGIIKALP